MKPSQLYHIVETQPKAVQCSMCDVKAKCTLYSSCIKKTITNIVDTDDIVRLYCKTAKVKTLASVDGICYNVSDTCLYLVEKKSWTQFFAHNLDVSTLKAMIDKEINDYNLQKKYDETCQFLVKITGNANLMNETSHSFIFFTDLDESVDPFAPLAQNLLLLGQTSSDNSFDTKVYVSEGIEGKVNVLTCKDKKVVKCHEFDALMLS